MFCYTYLNMSLFLFFKKYIFGSLVRILESWYLNICEFDPVLSSQLLILYLLQTCFCQIGICLQHFLLQFLKVQRNVLI